MKKTIREKVIEQIALQEEIQSLANINIVNCGHCGAVVLHRRVEMSIDNWEEGKDDIVCPYCDFTSEPCDFPDFLYDGMENSAEFDEEEPIKTSTIEYIYLDKDGGAKRN